MCVCVCVCGIEPSSRMNEGGKGLLKREKDKKKKSRYIHA